MSAKIKNKWSLVDKFPLKEYKCGLVAGRKVRLKKRLVIKDHTGKQSAVHEVGEIWEVLPGSTKRPIVVWFRRPDGQAHTWDDSSLVYDFFEVIEE